MTRETFKLVMAIGVLLNSALFLIGVLVIALVTLRPLVWRFDLAAIGVTYLSYILHFVGDHDAQDTCARWAPILTYLSIFLAGTAGVALLWS